MEPNRPPLPDFDKLSLTVSATVARGRVIQPVLHALKTEPGVSGLPDDHYVDIPDLADRVRLTSSDSKIVTVSDGALHAVAPGRATLSARLSGKADSVLVDVISGYAISVIEGSDILYVSGVNDAGDMIGGGPDSRSTFLIRQGSKMDIAPCLPKAINNAGQIACDVQDTNANPSWRPALRSEGQLSMIFGDTLGHASGITEAGEVFGRLTPLEGPPRVFVWSSLGATEWDGSFVSYTREINSSLRGVTVGGFGYMQSQLESFRNDGTPGIDLPALGRFALARAVNDAGDVVGVSECMYCYYGSAAIWRAANQWRAERISWRATDAVDISEAGYVVGNGADGGYLWRDGRYTILSDAIADSSWTITQTQAISRNGLIAAIGTKSDGTRAILLIQL